MTATILVGDCIEQLRTLPDASVNCCVTSPPYWGLRNYGVAGQLGLERDPREYLSRMVDVFREVRRALRPDGTLWVNMGDSYTDGGRGDDTGSTLGGSRRNQQEARCARNREGARPFGLGKKQLVMMPARLAIAMQEDGWILRSDIVWAKPNPMPESVSDRPTKAHEYLFLFAASRLYYYDADAIKEDSSPNTHARRAKSPVRGWATGPGSHRTVDHATGTATGRKFAAHGSGTKSNASFDAAMSAMPKTRNKRSVWTVTPMAFKGAHFATFPPKLIEPCILAGCPEGGTVLDPFGGAGTTGLVAERHGRNSILIELNPAYAEMARKRIHDDAPLFAEVPA